MAPSYMQNIIQSSAWLSTQQLTDGAIRTGSGRINPYFGNLAALGLLVMPCKYGRNLPLVGQVKRWLQWYISHLNATDIWGTGTKGTIYDYNITNNLTGTSLGSADSTDSYGASALSVAFNYYTAPGADKAYIASIQPQLDDIGKAVLRTQQADGLTWALPSYQMKFLQDNCEVYRGLSDLASLFTLLGNSRASAYLAAASKCRSGILSMYNYFLSMYNYSVGSWQPNLGAMPNIAVWYPDSVAQLFPVVYGVVSPTGPKAVPSFAYFKSGWANWADLPWTNWSRPEPDSFPWCLIGYGAALMSDLPNVNTYINNILKLYAPTFNWPFYCAEAAWFIRANSAILQKGYQP